MEKTKAEDKIFLISRVTNILKGAGAAAFSACIAETITIPMDTVKVRL